MLPSNIPLRASTTACSLAPSGVRFAMGGWRLDLGRYVDLARGMARRAARHGEQEAATTFPHCPPPPLQ
jgi:hypothetical protein